jgi:PAS domain S-box-containing protein
MSKESFDKKKKLKEVIKELHGGASPTQVKEKFKEFLKGTKPEDISKIEQELVKEGMPREELQRLCDVHLAVFGEEVQDQELHIPAGHPISILIEEHRVMLEKTERLETLVKMLEEACDIVYVGDALKELQSIEKDLQDSEKHYLREENVLFPIMEKHGVTEPPAIMWMEHNRIREKKKKLHDLVEKWNTMPYTDFKTRLSNAAKPLCSLLQDHFFKENNILFPTALQTVTDEEWQDVRKEFDEIGYPVFTPKSVLTAFQAAKSSAEAVKSSAETLQFETGSLSEEEAKAILDTLPVDISFVDKNDRVKYFNKAEKRIFVRTKAVIGRSVQLCHPQKSVHIVNRIIEAFTTGEKDTAEFWINMNNRLIHIRYFAVRDKKRRYLGIMEVTQDLTDLKKIEGEKRLLDWRE